MRQRVGFLILVGLVFSVTILGVAPRAKQRSVYLTRPSVALKTFLRNYLGGGDADSRGSTRVSAVLIQSERREADEYVIYVSGPRWCGSGGCTLVILQAAGSSFKVLGRVTVVQLPIRVLSSMNHGHPDIEVHVQGGGIIVGFDAVLSFNGISYPGNPSMPPAHEVAGLQGKEIITSTEHSSPLYD